MILIFMHFIEAGFASAVNIFQTDGASLGGLRAFFNFGAAIALASTPSQR
jgi:hypothetical protein